MHLLQLIILINELIIKIEIPLCALSIITPGAIVGVIKDDYKANALMTIKRRAAARLHKRKSRRATHLINAIRFTPCAGVGGD